MPDIKTAKIAILATDGFEEAELTQPLAMLKEAGAEVHVVSNKSGSIRAWNKDHWSQDVPVDRQLANVGVEDYDALVLPGGQINPDVLRTDARAVAFIKAFYNTGKTLAAICHAPWLLVEAEPVRGRELTSFQSIKTDVRNAGGNWVDREVVADQGLVTLRNPGDIPAFVAKIIEEVSEGRHADRRKVA